MIWFWLALAAVMLVVELATTALVSLWFVAGALCAALAAAFHLPVLVQGILFTLVSALLFLFCRNWVLKHMKTRRLPGNTERLLQEIGVVTVAIVPGEGGRIHVMGQDWKAISMNEVPIPEGERVRVMAIRGVKLEVVPLSSEQRLRMTSHEPVTGH